MRYQVQPLRQRRQPEQERPNCQARRHRQSGFLLLDIVLGCALLAIVFSAMLGSAHLYGKGQKKMDSRRAATRLAEAVLTDLQRGEKKLPVEGVKITQLEVHTAAGQVDGKMVWCEVNATANEIEVSLIGLVPRASLNAIKAATATQSTSTGEAGQPGEAGQTSLSGTLVQVNTSRQLQEVTP